MAKRPPLKLFDADEIKRSIAPLAQRLPSNRPSFQRPSGHDDSLPPEPTTPDEYVETIDRLWEEAQKSFLAIGRYLEEAQKKLSAEQFAHVIERLRFGKVVRSQIMTAYRAVTAGLLPPGVEAAGYSVVYHAATLSDTERAQAVAEGVIRPDMRRTEIVAFKRRIRTNAAQRDDDRRAMLEAERQRLLARVADIDRELSALA